MRTRIALGIGALVALSATTARADPPPAAPASSASAAPSAAGSSPPSAAPAVAPTAPPAPASSAAPVRSNEPGRISGVARPATEPSDVWRGIVQTFVSPVRNAVEFLFYAGEGVAGLVDDWQIVPRVSDVVKGRGGDIFVFPTAFAETGTGANVGVRMIAAGSGVFTSLRAGFGGPQDLVAEGRVRLIGVRPFAYALSLEGFFDERSDLRYSGVGEVPETDPRNHFRGPFTTGLYLQTRSRATVSIGARPSDYAEIFFGSQLIQSRISDDNDAGPFALTQVFAPQDIAAALGKYLLFYGELSVRVDTREHRGLPSPGVVLESYAGAAHGLYGDRTSFARIGGRAEGFIQVRRPTNILSPRLYIDGLVPTGPVPFSELPDQRRDFRGAGWRRDNLSLIGSLDYWWIFLRPLAARVFVDAATVGPSFAGLDFAHPRVAGGLGIAVASNSAEIGRLNIAAGTDGVRLTLTLGVAPGYGDRFHRY